MAWIGFLNASESSDQSLEFRGRQCAFAMFSRDVRGAVVSMLLGMS
jgi:hypothetical protein